MQLYQWLTDIAQDRGSGKALVYRDTYLSWRGLLHRVDRRAQELRSALSLVQNRGCQNCANLLAAALGP